MTQDKKPRTFQGEIENDVLKTAQMLLREGDPKVSDQEKHAIGVFKRVLTVVDKGGLSVRW